jgi:tetratricopeptide (TPR) repeat protein
MLQEQITTRVAWPACPRDRELTFLAHVRSRIGKALGVIAISMAMALGASARFLQPFSGYDAWFMSMTMGLGASADHSREEIVNIVAQIQRADYEGDRTALKRLHEELARFADTKGLAAQVQYWRGFALWRRAINGFNETSDPKEMQADLKQALADFEQAQRQRPNFTDAKVGALSCTGMLGVSLAQGNPARFKDPDIQEIIAKAKQFIKEAEAIDPQNPRLIWAKGPTVWHIPVEQGGGPEKVIEMYEKGLEVARQRNSTATHDPLEPSWGEPELLMGLAWAKVNGPVPDADAAERFAQSALKLVPYWHYAKDILLPQIETAKAKKSSGTAAASSK